MASPSTVGLVARITSSDLAGFDAVHQIRDAQLLRADAVEGRNGSVQHVIDAVVVPRLFDGGDVGRLFDHADEALVARGAACNRRRDQRP